MTVDTKKGQRVKDVARGEVAKQVLAKNIPEDSRLEFTPEIMYFDIIYEVRALACCNTLHSAHANTVDSHCQRVNQSSYDH